MCTCKLQLIQLFCSYFRLVRLRCTFSSFLVWSRGFILAKYLVKSMGKGKETRKRKVLEKIKQ